MMYETEKMAMLQIDIMMQSSSSPNSEQGSCFCSWTTSSA